MKKIFRTLLCLTAVVGMFSCTDTEKELNTIKLVSSDQNVTITENGSKATMTLSPTGSSAELTVESSAGWEVVGNVEDSWYKLTKSDNKIIVTADEFVSDYNRTSRFNVVLPDGVSAIVVVSQNGSEMADISFDKESIAFTERGGTQTLKIQANKEWTVTGHESSQWLNLDIDKENNSILITASANTTQYDFNTTLTFRVGNEINFTTKTLNVKLDRRTPAYINITRDMIAFPLDGGQARMSIVSNREWDFTYSATWFSIEREGEDLIITVDANPGGEIHNDTFEIRTTTGTDIITKNIAINQFSDPMILEYSIPYDNAKVNAPVTGEISCYIDWGDGNSDVYALTLHSNVYQPNHIYAKKGTYQIKIYGKVEWINSAHERSGKYLTAIQSWGDLGVTNLAYGFTNSNIESLPSGYSEVFKNVESFDFTFMNCAKLNAIPADMFKGVDVKKLASTFWNCPNITTVPAGLFDDLVNLEMVTSLFRGTGITTLPAGLFANSPNLRMVNASLMDCASLKTIPANLFQFNTNLESALALFANDRELEAIPADLFKYNPKLKDVSRAFENCTSLTSIPQELFDNCKSIINFYATFNGCANVDGKSPFTVIDGTEYRLFERVSNSAFVEPQKFGMCFYGCMNLDDYSDIPSEWK